MDLNCIELLNHKGHWYMDTIAFIKNLRTDPAIKKDFIEQIDEITIEDQVNYMAEHAKDYFIAYYYGLPVGFGGVIEDDIRYAVIPYYHGKGFGTQILKRIKNRNPNATGKIKKSNLGSMKAFMNAEIKYTLI